MPPLPRMEQALSVEEILKFGCEGWDLNPRTPARPAPQAGAFDLARQPSLRAILDGCRFEIRLSISWDPWSPDPSCWSAMGGLHGSSVCRCERGCILITSP